MKRKKKTSSSSQQQVVAATLPDECWESIFKFIINNNEEEDYNKNCHYLNSLSLVSKQFLSVTNRLRSSLTIADEPSCFRCIFKRFTNLSSLKLTKDCIDSNNLLTKISCFPLKHITSLNLSYKGNIPANGLRVFSQKIKTLKSLIICSAFGNFKNTNLFLIAECFPLLEELDISHPAGCENCTSYADGFEALSLALTKLRKVNLSGFPVNDESLFHLFSNCKNLEEVIIFYCNEISNVGIVSALPKRMTLRSLSFSHLIKDSDDVQLLATSHFIDSLVSLKGLTCLALNSMYISDGLLYSIAREHLPLTKLNLFGCFGHSYAGILCLLSKCQRVQHLNLQSNYFMTDQHVVQLSSFLGNLVSINLSCCRKLTKSILFALTRNCPSLSEIKMESIGSDIAGNSDSLGEFGVYPQLKSLYLGNNSWLSDEIIIMFASSLPNLQLLDLYACNCISEDFCQVLSICSKIRNLNLFQCSKVDLIGVNFVVPKLEVLDLSYTNVDDETLYKISKNCSGLLQLSLRGCSGVTKKGVKRSKVDLIGVNFVVPKLEVLDLSYTNVDDETLYMISKNCSGLLQLSLRGCSGVTKKGVKQVKKTCRQLFSVVLND